jgi:hypothetical protein
MAAGVTQAFSGGIDLIDTANPGFSFRRTMAAALLGGTVSDLSGGKFANGAVTAAFSYAIASGAQRQPGTADQGEPQSGADGPSFGRRLVRGALNVAGKIWALPNTIVGTVVGLAGVPFGATISFGNNGSSSRTTHGVKVRSRWATPSSMRVVPRPRIWNVGCTAIRSCSTSVGMREAIHTSTKRSGRFSFRSICSLVGSARQTRSSRQPTAMRQEVVGGRGGGGHDGFARMPLVFNGAGPECVPVRQAPFSTAQEQVGHTCRDAHRSDGWNGH